MRTGGEDGGGLSERIRNADRGTFVVCYRAALVVSVQNYLGESEQARKNSAVPGYMSVGMSGTFSQAQLRNPPSPSSSSSSSTVTYPTGRGGKKGDVGLTT